MSTPSQNLDGFFQKPRLVEAGEGWHERYAGAEPFPHVVLDDFCPAEALEVITAVIEGPDDAWIRKDDVHSRKRGCSDETVMDGRVRAFLHHLNAGPFLLFLEALTGIEGLVGDPHFHGGGLHQIERGGFLQVHADFNVHQKLRLDRRLNLLVYLNKDWEESYGGHLELWDREMKGCVRRILPVFNRCVIFSTTDDAHHGHPVPLACPPHLTRKSIALYYYTNGRPEHERTAAHSTLYRTPAGAARPRSRIGEVARLLAPPILVQAAKALRRRK